MQTTPNSTTATKTGTKAPQFNQSFLASATRRKAPKRPLYNVDILSIQPGAIEVWFTLNRQYQKQSLKISDLTAFISRQYDNVADCGTYLLENIYDVIEAYLPSNNIGQAF